MRGDAGSGDRPSRRALILVENLSVPFDRRVWQECTTLRDAGWTVHVICPRGSKRDTERSGRNRKGQQAEASCPFPHNLKSSRF